MTHPETVAALQASGAWETPPLGWGVIGWHLKQFFHVTPEDWNQIHAKQALLDSLTAAVGRRMRIRR